MIKRLKVAMASKPQMSLEQFFGKPNKSNVAVSSKHKAKPGMSNKKISKPK